MRKKKKKKKEYYLLLGIKTTAKKTYFSHFGINGDLYELKTKSSLINTFLKYTHNLLHGSTFFYLLHGSTEM